MGRAIQSLRGDLLYDGTLDLEDDEEERMGRWRDGFLNVGGES